MTLPPDSFSSHTIGKHPWGERITRILAAALAAVEPGGLVKKSVKIQDNQMIVGDISIDLSEYERIFLAAIGKASLPMAVSTAELLTNRITQGVILSKTDGDLPSALKGQNIKIHSGGHPVPSQKSIDSTLTILKMLSGLTKKDLVIILLSGGGSSLLASPMPGISLSDLQTTNKVLLHSGATIQEINTLRKHISSVKGGQLAKIASPARLVTLILSDVLGDPIDKIASGPTSPDPTTYSEALDIADRYQLQDYLPDSILNHLSQGRDKKIPETPKPDNHIFNTVTNLIIGNNQEAVNAGLDQAKTEGFTVIQGAGHFEGEASQVGSQFAESLIRLVNDKRTVTSPVCLISGGETTVTIPPTDIPGEGGRNLETALSAMIRLDSIKDAIIISLASDGEDGTTGAAGAAVSGESYRRAKEMNLNPEEELNNHNSYYIFDKLDDLIITGPTQTNVNDLCLLFSF